MPTAYLNIGSNRGDRRRFLDEAIIHIHNAWPAAVLRTSPPVESPAWGYRSEQQFMNIGVALDFDSASEMPAPTAMLRTLQNIEKTISAESPHRNTDGTYRDRDIDIDIIDMDGVTIDTPQLTIPHPRAQARSFVTGPMQYLCPGWTAGHKGPTLKKSMSDLARPDIETFRAKEKLPVSVVLDNIRSLNNIGSIFRTADAFAVREVVLCGISATPPSPEIHKTALGAENSVSWRYFPTTAAALDTLCQEGNIPVCLEQVHGSVALNRYNRPPGTGLALIVGNEVAGVDPAIVERCHTYIEIPQAGTKHSLNVAVSTAIALWQLFAETLP